MEKPFRIKANGKYKMKLNVPFYKQTSKLNCGPTALKMVLSYFGEDFDIKILEKETGIKKAKGVSTIQIAITSKKLGYETEFYSINLNFNEEHLKMDYYKKYSNYSEEYPKTIEKAKNIGVNVNEKSLSLEEILILIFFCFKCYYVENTYK